MADCDFTTPPGVPTWELMVTLLTTHTQAVHGGGGAPHPAPTNQSKLEKLPRPTFTLKMTESQWSFTKIQWENYIKQSPVSPAVQLMQLQAACDGPLQQRVFDTGSYAALTTSELFMAKMKELAVIVVHKSIHLMNLWKMNQQSDEPIRAFAARLTATADMCGMITVPDLWHRCLLQRLGCTSDANPWDEGQQCPCTSSQPEHIWRAYHSG